MSIDIIGEKAAAEPASAKATVQRDNIFGLIKSVKTKADEGKAATFLSEALSFTAKGIDGTYSQGYKMASGDHENVIR